jgi:hypothetical protein
VFAPAFPILIVGATKLAFANNPAKFGSCQVNINLAAPLLIDGDLSTSVKCCISSLAGIVILYI